jgi:hypothetical protein
MSRVIFLDQTIHMARFFSEARGGRRADRSQRWRSLEHLQGPRSQPRREDGAASRWNFPTTGRFHLQLSTWPLRKIRQCLETTTLGLLPLANSFSLIYSLCESIRAKNYNVSINYDELKCGFCLVRVRIRSTGILSAGHDLDSLSPTLNNACAYGSTGLFLS